MTFYTVTIVTKLETTSALLIVLIPLGCDSDISSLDPNLTSEILRGLSFAAHKHSTPNFIHVIRLISYDLCYISVLLLFHSKKKKEKKKMHIHNALTSV
jgi:hypothetical protein